MSLRLLSPGNNPYSYDCLDSELLSLKGGEVVTLRSLSLATPDLAAVDAFDGYTVASSVQKRTVVTKTLTSGKRPLMLCDDGTTGYGNYWGVVVGGATGQQVTGGVTMGPHTALASGKISVYQKEGLYAVSLDACDTNASTGLQPTNSTLDTGAALYATAAGLLTPTSGSAFETVVLGRFVEFSTDGSLVTTPNRLVGALTGVGAATRKFTFATFYFNPPSA